NDLDVIAAIIARLEDTSTPERRNEVFKLKNAAAADVAAALQTYLNASLTVLDQGAFLTAYQLLARQVVVVPEPVTNKLLISVTPEYYGEVLRLIEELDAQPPQVVVQVLIAEVQLNNTEEFGVEFGIQSPVLFRRGLNPDGVTINQTGFNFNSTAPLPNVVAADPGIVGFQGLGNFGLGRVGSTGVGGFVFSAASESFNLLIRALKSQGRIDILSRPQIHVLDNQTGFIQVGQSFPIVTGASISQLGTVFPIVTYVDTGVVLRVTPRISPDGRVLMRVEPSISSPSATQVSLGSGLFANAINVQQVQTTVLAADGETVAIGGLITRSDTRNENKVPWLGDLPWVGALFRFRSQVQAKRELLVILTPHILRSEADRARLLAEEARRIDWDLRHVAEVHGHGLEVFGPGAGPACPPGAGPLLPVPPGAAPPGAVLPDPAPAPPPTGPAPQPLIIPDGPALPGGPAAAETVPETPVGSDTEPTAGKEARRWRLFRRGD
ncbi:MAG TPA: secretin N-terminal domain-containing protein, partial [Gemmataceae bacterium]